MLKWVAGGSPQGTYQELTASHDYRSGLRFRSRNKGNRNWGGFISVPTFVVCWSRLGSRGRDANSNWLGQKRLIYMENGQHLAQILSSDASNPTEVESFTRQCCHEGYYRNRANRQLCDELANPTLVSLVERARLLGVLAFYRLQRTQHETRDTSRFGKTWRPWI